jgi:hypothetical protein
MVLLALDLLARIVAARIDATPPFCALFTLWLSMTQAVGLASRRPERVLARIEIKYQSVGLLQMLGPTAPGVNFDDSGSWGI